MVRILVFLFALVLAAPTDLSGQVRRADSYPWAGGKVTETWDGEAVQSLGGAQKNPYLALGLSTLLPGLGQFYNGQPGKGVLHLVLLFGSFVAAAEYQGIPEEVGLVGMFGTYVWSMIDAPLTAKRLNESRVEVSLRPNLHFPVPGEGTKESSKLRFGFGFAIRASGF
jgi:hypothetical protein